MSSDIERLKSLHAPIYDELDLLIKQAREQVEATFDLTVHQLTVMAQQKIAELDAKSLDYDASEYTNANNPPVKGVNER